MGLLSTSDGTPHALSARCVVGRHPGCEVRVDDPLVSTEHASVRWMDDRWEIRDLGSTNGTWVCGRRIDGGERVALIAGDTFAVGDRARVFTLVDASPPIAVARRVGTAEVRAANDGLIVLPDEDRPLISVFQDVGGRWVIEDEHEKRFAADRDEVNVAGSAWVLELPVSSGSTWGARAAEPTMETIALRLSVSRDEEHVEVTIAHGSRETTLPPRTMHYLLVLLARARLADTAASPGERGWVSRDELCRMLRVDTSRLNVDICRIRKQLAALGIHGISGIIARRPNTGLIRLGTDRFEIGCV